MDTSRRARVFRFAIACVAAIAVDFASTTANAADPNKILRALEAMRPKAYDGHLGLLLDLAPAIGVREVPDPYYGGLDGFERVLDLVEQASEELVARVRSNIDVTRER